MNGRQAAEWRRLHAAVYARLPYRGLTILAMATWLAGCVTVGGSLPHIKPDMARAARLNTQLGVDYARKGDLQLAQKKLQRAISEKDDYAPAHGALAYVYSRMGKAEAAEREYRRALSLDPGDPEIQNNFGTFLCSQGKGKEARTWFKRALANPEYATPAAAWTNAGICARNMEQPDVAGHDFQKALQADPDFAQAIEELAILSYRKGDYLRAQALEAHYRKIAKPGPDMLLLFAQTERALGNTTRARALEVQLVQTYPQSPQAAQISETRP